ncbi:MAG: hypothetical protein EBU34_13370, partial [Alphaproteobacteria bacterium]|nr:hypothetical protein [Alphaproteobacteria bacterium]
MIHIASATGHSVLNTFPLVSCAITDIFFEPFGGQTALNCLIALHDGGALKRFSVLNLGTPVETLKMTEDRDLFAQKMRSIGMPIPDSFACNTE